MPTIETAWPFILAIVSFVGGVVGGWVIATDKVRTEVYRRRFEAYHQLNKLAVKVFFASIRARKVSEEAKAEMFAARVEIMEKLAEDALFVDSEVGQLIFALSESTPDPDIEKLRVIFNNLTRTMAKDLHIEKSLAIDNVLMGRFGK